MSGLLRVTSSATEELEATSVRLYLKLEGETIAIGNAALEKAKELRELVKQLQAAGIPTIGLTVQNVRVSSHQGLLLKNQRAEFTLKFALLPEYLAATLGVISQQKHIQMTQLEWIFEDHEASVRLSAQAMQKAKRKAEAIAQAAETRVTGVHHASDTQTMPNPITNYAEQMFAAPQSIARNRNPSLDIGMEYSATRHFEVTLTVDFILENDHKV